MTQKTKFTIELALHFKILKQINSTRIELDCMVQCDCEIPCIDQPGMKTAICFCPYICTLLITISRCSRNTNSTLCKLYIPMWKNITYPCKTKIFWGNKIQKLLWTFKSDACRHFDLFVLQTDASKLHST